MRCGSLASSTAFTNGSTSGGGLGGMTGTKDVALSAGAVGTALVDGAAVFAAVLDATSDGADSVGLIAGFAALVEPANEVAGRASGALCLTCD